MNYNLLVENFLEVLASEKGLSKNTLYSYKNDLDQFIDFIQKKNLESINFRDREIKEFISTFKNKGYEFLGILYGNSGYADLRQGT